jgi:hypothetical protein
MEGFDKFRDTFCQYATFVLWQGRLIPQFSIPRLAEAHGAWQNDLARVGKHEKRLENGLDHFKQAGHLTYWLRRMGPIVEATDATQNPGDSEGYPLTQDEIAFRNLMLGHCNEYLAFDFGFQIVKFYELSEGECRAKNLTLSPDYIGRMCHFLKYKHVSPHALHIIFNSLFIG